MSGQRSQRDARTAPAAEPLKTIEALSLDAFVARYGPLSVEQLSHVGESLVAWLEAAAESGLTIPRLTPATVVLGPLDPREGVRGIRRDIPVSVSLAGPDEISPDECAYVSPEQPNGGEPDARAHVFALASVVQFALDGAHPPPPTTFAAGVRGPSLPATSDATYVIALARSLDPTLRYPEVGTFWVALDSALAPARDTEPYPVVRPPLAARMPDAVAPDAVAPDFAPDGEDGEDAGDGQPLGTWRRRATGVAFAAAGGLMILAGAAALARTAWPPEPARAVATSAAVRRPAATPSPESLATVAALGGIRYTAQAGGALRTPGSAPTLDAFLPRPDSSGLLPAAAPVVDSAASSAEGARLALPALADVSVPTVDLGVAAFARREVTRADDFVSGSALWFAPDLADGPPRDVAVDSATAASARQHADQAVQAFARALAARDLAALRRAAPELSASEEARWAKLFHDARAIAAELAVTDVRLSGDVISAVVRGEIAVRLPGLRAPVRSDAQSVVTLVRDSSGWRMRTTP